jgi:L,D-transpeptidase ErfK/SrfK
MFPEDIEQFFKMVPIKTPVRIVHQASKAGWQGEVLFVEVHPPLEGNDDPDAYSLTNITRSLVAATKNRSATIDWARAEQIFRKASGVPEAMTGELAPDRTVDVAR